MCERKREREGEIDRVSEMKGKREGFVD